MLSCGRGAAGCGDGAGDPAGRAVCERLASVAAGGTGRAVCGTFDLYPVFALPVDASYTRPGEKRPACTTGVYALCRHPGVLWFTGLYICLWLALGLPLWEAAVYSGLNVLLVVFEDRCVFPARLEGYGAYQAATPFLLPNRRSIRACRKVI